MKQILYFFAVVSLTFFSCDKRNCIEPTSAKLEGNWRMIAVKDNSSGLITTKPGDVNGNVDLTFTARSSTSGVFYGHTPTNDISESDYSTARNNQLTIPFLSMTKVQETSWGKEFVDNIRSAQKYGFDSDSKLVINTTNKTLTFRRW